MWFCACIDTRDLCELLFFFSLRFFSMLVGILGKVVLPAADGFECPIKGTFCRGLKSRGRGGGIILLVFNPLKWTPRASRIIEPSLINKCNLQLRRSIEELEAVRYIPCVR